MPTSISARIHARVVSAWVDVVTLRDQMVRSCEILLRIFHSDGVE